MHYNDPTVSCPGYTFVTIFSVILTIRRCPFTLLGGERQCERQIYFPRTILFDKARTRPGVQRSIHWAMAFIWVGHLVSVQT